MKSFAELFTKLDQTTKINQKVNALTDYFERADDKDKLWTMAILSHRRPKRSVKVSQLKEWAAEISNIPQWLFEESYHVVGDLAETVALVLPEPTDNSEKTLSQWVEFISSLSGEDDGVKKEKMLKAWASLEKTERFVLNKLITGGFRMGVSQKLMVKALSKHTKIEESNLAHRLMGNWSPLTDTFESLIWSENVSDDASKPYPFYLAYALEDNPADLGDVSEWQAEYKWDGIRGQIISRNGELFVWSRGEELVTDKYPEYHDLVHILPDGTVLDGEILPFKHGRPLPFGLLQTRIGRKNLTKKALENSPVIFKAYDIMELDGEDIRSRPIVERREQLERVVAEAGSDKLRLSDIIKFNSWDDLSEKRDEAREKFSEGIMLKRKNSEYKDGRKRGDWWKWKVDPLTIDAVLIYAMRGHGRRANLYSDYTFAVWNGDQLVPFTKAYSGLTDKEIVEVDRFVKKNTIERFGPVRSVTPELVFEIAFEGINKSTRHKSGIALRFPRMKRWRKDKPKEEANTLDDLTAMLEQYGSV
ncbi:MAG: ATP-dependent DNA ligase [Bacteroidota bacterium]